MKVEIKWLLLSILTLNILPVFCIIEDCKNLGKFIQRNGYSYNSQTDCCEGVYDNEYDLEVTCEDGYITKIDFNVFGNKVFGESETFPLLEKLTDLSFSAKDRFPNLILPSRFFDIPNLKKLEVHQVYKMPTSINAKSPVEELILSDNRMVAFPYIFKNLKKLKILDLRGNTIEGELTDEIYSFTELEELYLNNNKMKGELRIPEKLKIINLTGNGFSSYSSKNKNKALEEIYGSGNYFDNAFMEKLSEIEPIRKIYVQNNNITKLPNAIFNLTNIEEFDISSNVKLKAKIINFGYEHSIPVNHCNFHGVTIECYQNNTCSNQSEIGASSFKNCTEKDINQVRFGNSAFTIITNANIKYLIIALDIAL